MKKEELENRIKTIEKTIIDLVQKVGALEYNVKSLFAAPEPEPKLIPWNIVELAGMMGENPNREYTDIEREFISMYNRIASTRNHLVEEGIKTKNLSIEQVKRFDKGLKAMEDVVKEIIGDMLPWLYNKP